MPRPILLNTTKLLRRSISLHLNAYPTFSLIFTVKIMQFSIVALLLSTALGAIAAPTPAPAPADLVKDAVGSPDQIICQTLNGKHNAVRFPTQLFQHPQTTVGMRHARIRNVCFSSSLRPIS